VISSADVPPSLFDADLAKLRRRIERLVNGGLPFDDYLPESYLESDIQAVLHDFHADELPSLVEVYATDADSWSATYDVRATLEGAGDAHWNATQLSPLDLDAFGRHVEATDAGGILQEVEGQCPCRIEVNAGWTARGRAWIDVEVVAVSLDAEETARRQQHHEELEFRRLKVLGLMPPDIEPT